MRLLYSSVTEWTAAVLGGGIGPSGSMRSDCLYVLGNNGRKADDEDGGVKEKEDEEDGREGEEDGCREKVDEAE